MFALRLFSLVPECVAAAAAADKREEHHELVEVPGSVELLGSVVVQVPVAAADSEVVFRFFAWVPVSGTLIVLFLVLFSHFLAASSAFLARFSAFFFAASLFSFFFCSLSAFRLLFSSISFYFCSRSSRIAAHFALVSTLAPDTRLAAEVLRLGVALEITCTRYFDMYLRSGSDSPELVPESGGVELGVVTGVLMCTLELRVGDVLASPTAEV